MRIIFVVLFSIIALAIGVGRAEGHMPWRTMMQILPNREKREWSREERKVYRKKEYKVVFAVWAAMTAAAIVFVVFFRG